MISRDDDYNESDEMDNSKKDDHDEKGTDVEVCFAPDGTVVVKRNVKVPKYADGNREEAASRR